MNASGPRQQRTGSSHEWLARQVGQVSQDMRIVDRLFPGIPLADLETVSKAVMLRLEQPEQEERRVHRMRELLRAASELNRALALHTQHALVDCCGTHGTGDLATDAAVLHRALVRYAQLVAALASEYGGTDASSGVRSDSRVVRHGARAAVGAA